MKTRIAFLALFLFLSRLPAAQYPAAHLPPSAPVGSIVTVSGNINSIDANTGSISLGSDNIVFVTADTTITVNGKRGRISDLVAGMKVTGSAEIANGDTRRAPQKKIVRMLNAIADPSYHAPATPAPRYATLPQFPPGIPAPGIPAPGIPAPGIPAPRMPTSGFPVAPANAAVTGKLSGTYWDIPNPRKPDAPRGKLWICLNADGTTSSSEGPQTGTWRVFTGLTVQITYFIGPFGESGILKFSDDLKTGMDSRWGPIPAYAWTLIPSPTEEMLAKVSQRPAQGVPAGFGAPTPNPISNPAVVSAAIEAQRTASELVKANHDNLVFVTGKDGAGSGFIAHMGGATFLVTNAHVAAGINDADFKTLEGAVLPRGAAGVAVGHDIFRMALPPNGKPFEVMNGVTENAGIGDDVVVLGNAEGSGVINTIMGKIVGIGPNLVEVDAQFVPGNSGSPIVHLKTGKVIGVATYTVTRKYDAATKEKMKEPVIRRFGYRLDSVKTWQPVNWPGFYAQAGVMEKIHTLTEALDNFFRDLYEKQEPRHGFKAYEPGDQKPDQPVAGIQEPQTQPR